MAVIINDTCINCGACIDECPVEAIVDEVSFGICLLTQSIKISSMALIM